MIEFPECSVRAIARATQDTVKVEGLQILKLIELDFFVETHLKCCWICWRLKKKRENVKEIDSASVDTKTHVITFAEHVDQTDA